MLGCFDVLKRIAENFSTHIYHCETNSGELLDISQRPQARNPVKTSEARSNRSKAKNSFETVNKENVPCFLF